MDITNSTVKTPEAENETPTRIQQPATKQPTPFTNGVLKRHPPLHHHNHHHHHHHPIVVTYKECLRNHAATLGGHALDGCGEFMPSPNCNPADPTSLKCAACGCHRNFHRREPDEPNTPPLLLPPPNPTPALEYQPHHRHHPPPPPLPSNPSDSQDNSPSPPPISSAYYPSAPHMLLALSHGGGAGGGSVPPPDAVPTPIFSSGSGRKRFRTKFTQEQKDKMLEFSERVGWKMQKKDEDIINEFCNKIGVERGVFKVWMHNNKNNSGKKDNPISTTTTPIAGSGNGGAASINFNSYQEEDDNRDIKEKFHGLEMNQQNNTHHHVLGTNNGSSSSS